MSLDDLGGILRGLSSQASFVRLAPSQEARVRELVRELQQILANEMQRTA